MDNSITGAFKKKEYGWFALLIASVVIGAQWFGIAGAVGSTIISYGLYRSIKNPVYATGKKILMSSAYVIGGAIVTFVILTVLKSAFSMFFGMDFASTSAAKQVLNSTNAATSIQLRSSGDTSRLEPKPYRDSASKYQILYPKGWLVSNDGLVIAFDDPDQSSGAEVSVMVNPEMGGYTLQQYAAGGMQGFASDNAAIKNVQIISQGNATLNGDPAYSVEYTYEYETESFGTYTLHARTIYLIHESVGYNIFITNAWDQWERSEDLLTESMMSFQFLK